MTPIAAGEGGVVRFGRRAFPPKNHPTNPPRARTTRQAQHARQRTRPTDKASQTDQASPTDQAKPDESGKTRQIRHTRQASIRPSKPDPPWRRRAAPGAPKQHTKRPASAAARALGELAPPPKLRRCARRRAKSARRLDPPRASDQPPGPRPVAALQPAPPIGATPSPASANQSHRKGPDWVSLRLGLNSAPRLRRRRPSARPPKQRAERADLKPATCAPLPFYRHEAQHRSDSSFSRTAPLRRAAQSAERRGDRMLYQRADPAQPIPRPCRRRRRLVAGSKPSLARQEAPSGDHAICGDAQRREIKRTPI